MSLFSPNITPTNIIPWYPTREEASEASGVPIKFSCIPSVQIALSDGLISGGSINIYRPPYQYINSTPVNRVTIDDVIVSTYDEYCALPAGGVFYLESVQGPNTFYSHAIEVSECNRYKLEWWNDCDTNTNVYSNGFKHLLEFEKIHKGLSQVEPVKTGVQEKDGTRTVVDAKYIPSHSVNLILPNDSISALYAMCTLDNVQLTDAKTGIVIDIENISITPGNVDSQKAQKVTILFNKVKERAVEKARCCVVEDILTDICDPDGNNSDPSCAAYTVAIQGIDTFSILETNPPTGTYSVVWFKEGIVIGTGLTQSKMGYGNYTAQVSNGNCTKSALLPCPDPCTTISIRVTTNNTVINPTGLGGDGNYTFEYFFDPDGDNLPGASVGTGNSYAVNADGYYTVVVTDGNGCTAQTTFYMDIADVNCGHTVNIVRTGKTLTGSMTGCTGIERWKVYLDSGSGESLIAETNTVEINANGIYIFEGLCNDCPVREQKLILNAKAECVPIEIKAWPETPIDVNIDGVVEIDGSVEVDGCVSVCPTPICEVFGTLEDQFICLDNVGNPVNTITLTPQISGFTQPVFYCWSTDENTPSIVVNPTEETTYTVTITDVNGCTLELEATVYVEDLQITANAECFSGDSLTVTWTGTNEVVYELYINDTDCDTYTESNLTLISTGINTTGEIALSGLGLTQNIVVRVYPTYESGCAREVCFEYVPGAGSPGTGGKYAGCIDSCATCYGEWTEAIYSPIENMDKIKTLVLVGGQTVTLSIDQFTLETGSVSGDVEYVNTPIVFTIGPGNINIIDGLITNVTDVLNSLGVPGVFFYPAEYECPNGFGLPVMRVRFPACYTWSLGANDNAPNADKIHIESDGTMILDYPIPDTDHSNHPPCSDYPIGRFGGHYNDEDGIYDGC